MTKGIRPGTFNKEHYTQGTAAFHRFHGGKVRHIRNQIETHLQEEGPDAAIIMIGGNDLSTLRGEKPIPVINIANQIIRLCDTLQEIQCSRHLYIQYSTSKRRLHEEYGGAEKGTE